jgi:hypothetical protein
MVFVIRTFSEVKLQRDCSLVARHERQKCLANDIDGLNPPTAWLAKLSAKKATNAPLIIPSLHFV